MTDGPSRAPLQVERGSDSADGCLTAGPSRFERGRHGHGSMTQGPPPPNEGARSDAVTSQSATHERSGPRAPAGRFIAAVEHVIKGPVWGCQMCGQCILHDTGFTCPMNCPKQMRNGPCGGVGPNGECEVLPDRKCVWLKAYERARWSPGGGHIQRLHPAVDWELQGTSSWLNFLSGRDHHRDIQPVALADKDIVMRSDSKLEKMLREGQWVTIGEVNPPDGGDLSAFASIASGLSRCADVLSVTEHPGARNHMSSLPAAALLQGMGIETVATFTCRDRNRIALQGDLLGAAGLGIRNVLLVTGNHMSVGDHPGAKPVFDLDSVNLIRLARRLRDEGVYDSGRPLQSRPRLLLGCAVAPFAPPVHVRASRLAKKIAGGADFAISQHIFDIARWKAFVQELNRVGPPKDFWLVGAVAVLPSLEVARSLNQTLHGFTIPEAILRRLAGARDPQAEGISIAAETISELRSMPEVSGCLVAALSGGEHVMTSHLSEAEVAQAVIAEAGLSSDRAPSQASPEGQGADS
jgi:methylenetetrahydrofolate reductase (NADPH)